MNVLEPGWLAATIEGELSEALRHWEDRHQSIGKSRGLPYDDGSNLRIPSAKKGPVVQIIKFLNFEEPIQVTLSDSVIRVNASIANQASQRYAQKNRRKLTEGTVGGLIQLLEFEIVATHLGPRDRKLTLYVKDFKTIGANGSGDFGVAPQAVESRGGTKELLNKLADLRKHSPDEQSEHSVSVSPIRSQPSIQTSETGSIQDSQVGFATQVPRYNAPLIGKPKASNPTAGMKFGSTSTANSAKSLAPPTMANYGKPLADTLSHFQLQAAPPRPSVSSNKNLLGILQNPRLAAPAPEIVSEPRKEPTPGLSATPIGPAVVNREKEASQDITFTSNNESASRASVGSQKRKRHSPDIAPRKKAPDNVQLHGIYKGRESLAVDRGLDGKTKSGAALTDASIKTVCDRSSTSELTQSHPDAPVEASSRSISKHTSLAPGQNPGRNRISSRDVKIPRDQEDILSRADSWLPAEPGQREPTANIPISLLKTLNRKADISAQRPVSRRKLTNRTMISNAVIDQTADSESDVPLSSGQWPASPERDQLPPDSSSGSTEHSDHLVQRLSKTPLSVSSSRRQSHVSISSHSMPSGRPSPISARRLSHGVSSPGGTTPSAGEEVHRFTCQASGCDKSYKNSGGLKHHMDRHHTSTGSFESFGCPVKECANSYGSPGRLKYHIEHHHDGNAIPPRPPRSYGGSATPTTTTGAPDPVSPGLKLGSECDEGSGRKLADSGANKGSDNAEVSASILSLFDRRPTTPGDGEDVKRRSRTDSVLNSTSPPDAQPAPVQSRGINLDEIHLTKEKFSPLLRASPTSESDLEMTVPLPLNEKADSVASSAPMKRFPSTASQPQDPFTQVKRTPYSNGRVQNKSLPRFRTLSSPLKANFYPLTNGIVTDDTDFVSASVISGPDTSTAETHGEDGSSGTAEDQNVGKLAARLTEESESQEVANGNLDKPLEVVSEDQQGRRKADAAEPIDSAFLMTESQSQIREVNQPSMVAEANAKIQTMPERSTTTNGNHLDSLPQLTTPDHTVQIVNEMKRKVADSSLVSPGMAKRQKRFKVPSAFVFTERSEIPGDPSERARQYRQDFLTSRRSSENSTPTMSPTISFTNIPGTTSENSLDPSDRARQMRQEIPASRRGSETSTSTTSPRIEFTALAGMIKAGGWNVNEKDVDNVIVQKQLADTEIEHQKMTEVKKSFTRARTQDMGLVAAALANGTASTKSDENAKPGAACSPSSEYELYSLSFVEQNADVESPDAEQSTVIKASSYVSKDDTQRAQSVELDVSFQAPGHQDAEHELGNAKNDVEQTVDPGMGPTVASNDQLAKNNRDGQPVGPEPDKACEDLASRADEVAKQGNNGPTSEVTLDPVIESDRVALGSLYQRQSIEENADTKISNEDSSEPILEQQSVTVDADQPTSDKTATEPSLQQRLGGVDTNPVLLEVQGDQDVAPSKHITFADAPMNQSSSTLPVAAFAAESDIEDQTYLSTAAVEPSIPVSNSMSDAELKSVEGPQNVEQLPIEITNQGSSSAHQSIFDLFKAAYPAYPGDTKHFAAICRKISQLVKANRMEHQSLWDDFIVRHKIEYPQYLRRCAEEAEDAVPYEDFYQTKSEGPICQQHVINRQNLVEALALVAQKSSDEHVHVEPIKESGLRVEPVGHKSNPKSDTVVENSNHQFETDHDDKLLQAVRTKTLSQLATSNEIVRKAPESLNTVGISAERVHSKAVRDDGSRDELVKAQSALMEATSSEIVQKPSESPVIIDLTDDDPPDDQPRRAKPEVPPQSRITHLVNGVHFDPSRFQCRPVVSRSLHQVPYTPPPMQGSHVPPPPQWMRSQLVPATASTKSSPKSLRRSLPWNDSGHSVPQKSPNAVASETRKPLPRSSLREIRAKESSNVGGGRFQVSAESIPESVKQSQDFLNACQRVIQSNWGIKAHELLEPELYHGRALPENCIELLAEIASKVKVGEARNRIKEAIDTRTRDSARQGAGHPKEDRKMLKSDLEVVRGIVETSSMSTTSPFSLPHTNAAVEKQNEDAPSEWWDDANSPFKSFARAYASIRRGKGNSFAKAESAQPGDIEKAHKAASGGVQLKKMDFMRWNL